MQDNTNEVTNTKQKNVEQSSWSVDDEQVRMPSIGTNLQLIDYDELQVNDKLYVGYSIDCCVTFTPT